MVDSIEAPKEPTVEPAKPAEARQGGAEREPPAETQARGLLLGACAAVAGGLAIAGTVDANTGGAIVLAGWLVGVAALHRLGRAGSAPRPRQER